MPLDDPLGPLRYLLPQRLFVDLYHGLGDDIVLSLVTQGDLCSSRQALEPSLVVTLHAEFHIGFRFLLEQVARAPIGLSPQHRPPRMPADPERAPTLIQVRSQIKTTKWRQVGLIGSSARFRGRSWIALPCTLFHSHVKQPWPDDGFIGLSPSYSGRSRCCIHPGRRFDIGPASDILYVGILSVTPNKGCCLSWK